MVLRRNFCSLPNFPESAKDTKLESAQANAENAHASENCPGSTTFMEPRILIRIGTRESTGGKSLLKRSVFFSETFLYDR